MAVLLVVVAALFHAAVGWSPESKAKTEALLKRMTLQDKVAMLHGYGPKKVPGGVGFVVGNEDLQIPPLILANGPQGWGAWAGDVGNATAFPSSLTVAATWDTKLAARWGVAMGTEFWEKGTNVQLGPGLCLARVPTGGRNFEYLSGEDPFLGYTLVQPLVKGIQGQHVLANAKHWVLNNQETDRSGDIAMVDERTRFEMYYPPFEGAIKAGVASMMCSFNKINGAGDDAWSCGNKNTLAGDLKGRLGFEGFVMSDWGATHSTAIEAGLDMEQPNAKWMGDKLLAAVKAGNVSADTIDDSVGRMLAPMFEFGVVETYAQWTNLTKRSLRVTSKNHSALARELAAAGTVLLKNTAGVLPIVDNVTKRILVVGAQARDPSVHGGGSGEVIPTYVIAPLEGISERAATGTSVAYDDGSDPATAAAKAATVDLVIVVVGMSSHEGVDRANLSFPTDQVVLVAAIAAAAGSKTVVAAINPGSVLLPWDEAVAATLLMFVPGLECGHALADVLWGDVNPTARLPITMPNKDNEVEFTKSMYPGVGGTSHYSEELLVGYRYYDHHKIVPKYPFGHGLSFTEFDYSRLEVDSASLVLNFTVTNAGSSLGGATVAQAYLGFPASAGEPPKQLKGFHKTAVLAPGASEHITIELTARDLSTWDVGSHAWVKQSGKFTVEVGESSRDTRLTGSLHV